MSLKKVLVIDDEPFILMMLEDKFKRAGLKVVALRSTVGALDVIRTEKPDLIILDWMMPEISGLELCRKIKSDAELAAIPIFMLTAKGQAEDERRGLECGAAKFITKPFSPKALLATVLEHLKGGL